MEKEKTPLIQTALGNYPSKIRNKVVNGLKKSSNISDFHIYLQRNLKQDCHAIYKTVKPYYMELKAAV